MNKWLRLLIIALFAFVIYLFTRYLIIPAVVNFVNEISSTSKSEYIVSVRNMDKLKYKSTEVHANEEMLDYIFINIANDLKKENNFTSEYDNVDNFYELQPYFLEYRLYLATKYKIIDIAKSFETLKAIKENRIENYFFDNLSKIENLYGIKNLEDFTALVNTAKFVNSSNINLVSTSIIHNSSTRTISFIVEIDELSFSVVVKPYYQNGNQAAPYVSIFDTSGGIS